MPGTNERSFASIQRQVSMLVLLQEEPSQCPAMSTTCCKPTPRRLFPLTAVALRNWCMVKACRLEASIALALAQLGPVQ